MRISFPHHGHSNGSDSAALRSNYFKTVKYTPAPLPLFEKTKASLPAPVYDEKPMYVDMYWKTWEIAFRNFHAPTSTNGFVSQFIDTALTRISFSGIHVS